MHWIELSNKQQCQLWFRHYLHKHKWSAYSTHDKVVLLFVWYSYERKIRKFSSKQEKESKKKHHCLIQKSNDKYYIFLQWAFPVTFVIVVVAVVFFCSKCLTYFPLRKCTNEQNNCQTIMAIIIGNALEIVQIDIYKCTYSMGKIVFAFGAKWINSFNVLEKLLI